MSKKLIISESEKNEIKKLYQLNEQTFLDALLDFDSISNNDDTTKLELLAI